MVELSRLEEWDLFGVPYGVPICSPVHNGPSFLVHSSMITRAGVRPPFTPFEKRLHTFLRVAPSQIIPLGLGSVRAYDPGNEGLRPPTSVELLLYLFDVVRNPERNYSKIC